MSDAEVIEKINYTLSEEFELNVDQFSPEARFKEDLGLDSLDAVDMVVVLEQAFKFKITKTDSFQNIRTVGDLHEYVLQRRRELVALGSTA